MYETENNNFPDKDSEGHADTFYEWESHCEANRWGSLIGFPGVPGLARVDFPSVSGGVRELQARIVNNTRTITAIQPLVTSP